MGKAFQTYPHVMKTLSWSAGGNDTLSFDSLPLRIQGRTAHFAGFYVDVFVDPTYTTAPTIAGINSILSNVVFYDGAQERMNLSGFDMRNFEIAETGKLLIPDPPTTNGSTNEVCFRRFFPVGPLQYEGNPTDFVIPCAALKSGELRFRFGALTDFSADTTVLGSMNIRVTAVLVALDKELRLPPAFERRTINFGATDCLIQGRALYTFLGIMKQANTAFATGDLSEISWDGGQGQSPSVICSTLTAIFHAQMRAGQVNQTGGEPRVATYDLNSRTPNLGAFTALGAAELFMQPVIVSPDNSRITKILWEASAGMRVRWTGSFATPKILVARILEQPETAYAALGARAATALGIGAPTGAKVKTLDKTPYKGPRTNYMPWALKY